MPPPPECGAGRETEGWAGSGRPHPIAFRAAGPARRRAGGAGTPRPLARIGRALATPCGPLPALATPLQPNSSSVNPAWAGRKCGPSRCLPLGASLPLRSDAGLLSLALPGVENLGSGKYAETCLVHHSLKAWSFRPPLSGEGVAVTSQILVPNL